MEGKGLRPGGAGERQQGLKESKEIKGDRGSGRGGVV